MLRIFGFYQFSNCGNLILGENIVREMAGLPDTKSKFTKLEIFNLKNIFLAYESLNSNESNRYFFINENKQSACFVVGNVFAYEKEKLDILFDKNIAKFIFEIYKKESFSFLRYLRGEFNIVIIDKEKLYLINDELGLSSMFIYRIREGITFCSEAEPIIWLNKDNQINYSSIAEFLVFGFIPDGKTFIKNLNNQLPGTIVLISRKNFVQKKYSSIHIFPELNNHSLKERAKFVKNLFLEAVKIRMPPNELVVQELSGGWDTRFVLANLLSLKVDPLAITFLNTSQKDLFVAKYLTKKIGIKHYIVNERRNNLKRAFDYDFRLYKRDFFLGSRNIFFLSENEKDHSLYSALLSKIFTGLFGSEIFGYMSHTFLKLLNKDPSESKLIFSEKFLSKLNFKKKLKYKVDKKSHNVFYLFLTQFVRSYWNIYINIQRDRIFDFLSLNPFTDSKIVAVMGSLNYSENMYYKLYTEMYKQYNPVFLKVPYTFEYYRKINFFTDTFEIEYDMEKKEFVSTVLNNQDFFSFLKDNQIIKSERNFNYEDLRKLYCLFSWFDVYKSVLNQKHLVF